MIKKMLSEPHLTTYGSPHEELMSFEYMIGTKGPCKVVNLLLNLAHPR